MDAREFLSPQKIAPLNVDTFRFFWLVVLARVFEEASGKFEFLKDADEPNVSQSAREWLLSDERDFQLVCAWAGQDAQQVREEARRRWQQTATP